MDLLHPRNVIAGDARYDQIPKNWIAFAGLDAALGFEIPEPFDSEPLERYQNSQYQKKNERPAVPAASPGSPGEVTFQHVQVILFSGVTS